MKKINKLILVLIITVLFNDMCLAGNIDPNKYRDIEFSKWDVAAASKKISKQAKKAFTIMIYMNGSDLESESGAATEDLLEMIDSGVDTEAVNIVLFTGGTNRWQNDIVPANKNVIWKIADGGLEELASVGLLNMGNSGTLAGFIDFTIQNFPADKYGLIMWDHGGGSIAGYGHDEKFNNSNLTLLEMDYAFHKSALSNENNKLEFLGFDSCLMATVEMAVIASDYARYLIASEDLEPGQGWNYAFLTKLNNKRDVDGASLGVAITDYFIDFYGLESDEFLTLSVIDLSNVKGVMDTMGSLMDRCTSGLLIDRAMSFSILARKRHGTKTFGEGSPRDNECDMVDIGDMAYHLSDIFPVEAEAVMSSLNKAVVYNRHNSDVDLKGLSTYYIYGGKNYAYVSLPMYASLNLNNHYTGYLYNFADILLRENVTERNARRSSQQNEVKEKQIDMEDITDACLTVWQSINDSQDQLIMTGIRGNAEIHPDGTWTVDYAELWPSINGHNVCLYEVNNASNHSLYAVPAVRNGVDCDIMIVFSSRYPEGRIAGARQNDGIIIQKGYDEIKKGDKISFYYQKSSSIKLSMSRIGDFDNWYKSKEISVGDELNLEWVPLDSNETYYALRLTDIWNNIYYTDIVK